MSTTFSITRDELISGALRKLGALSQGQLPSSIQYQEAAQALNLLVKSWETIGMPLWALRTTAIPLTLNQNTYDIGIGKTINTDKPLKIIQAWNRDLTSNIDIPMRLITKQEYNILGNKTSSGNPIQIYYEPLKDYGTIHLFPTPSSSFITNNEVYIVYQRPFEDFNSSTDVPDFPQEWYEAILYGLAVRLAPEYGIPIDQRQVLGREASAILDAASSFGTEEGSLYLQADYRRW